MLNFLYLLKKGATTMSTSSEIFGRNLRNRLDARNRTQADLARHLNVTPTAVSRWVNGDAMPRPNMVDRICSYLNCNVEDLMADHTKVAVLLPEDVLAEEIHNNPRLFQLFMVAMKSTDADLVHCIEYLQGKKK